MTDPEYRDVPATEVQQGLWLLRALGREPAPRCRTYRVVGDLDTAAVSAAWRVLVERYAGLRSELVLRDGAPVRRVWTEAEQAELSVTRIGPEDHRVRLTVSAAFADEDFLDALVRELSELCGGGGGSGLAASRRTADQPSQPDHADQLKQPGQPGQPGQLEEPHELGQSDRPDPDALAWWLSALTPLPSELPLPADRPRPERASGRSGEVSVPADPELGRILAGAAASPFVVMLTALQALLHRYTGADRVAVAVPVASGVPGSPADVLVLPADIDPKHSFTDLLDRAAPLVVAALARRDVPLARVVGALPVAREAQRVPLCDVVFDYRRRPRAVLAIPGTAVEPCPVPADPAPADLVLSVDDSQAGPALTLLYDADQYDPATAHMILRQYRTLLRHAVRTPDTAVGELALDGPGEAARAAAEADRRADDGATGHTVVEAIRRRAWQDPDTLAVDGPGSPDRPDRPDGPDGPDGPQGPEGPDSSLTYRALYAAAVRVAEDLRAAGVRAGDAVVVRIPVGVRQYAALLGVLSAGAHLSWFGVADSGDRGRAVLGALKPAAMLVAAGSGPDELLDWYRATAGGQVVAVGEPDPEPRAHAPAAPTPSPALADRAYVAFTSGSTGVPKGIAQTHAALAQFAAWLAAEFEIGPGVRVAQWVAAEHDPALAETFAALSSGATLCPVPEKIRANPERLLDWLAAERIGVLQTVPSFAREILRVLTERHRTDRLGALRVLLLMGEALPGELAAGLMAALPLVRVANLYGPTETVAATWHEAAGAAAGPVPIGRPIPGRGVLVVDEQDRPCPAGVTGELVVTGRYVAEGYLGGHDRRAFAPLPGVEGPCYRTGDLARRRADGALEYRGRKDSQVKLYGSRLELTDVEAALAGHATVAECAVVAGADRDGLAVRLVICVVPRRGPDGEPLGSPDQWRTHLRRRFGRALLPALYRTLDRLPRTVTGKVDRPRLARGVAAAERDAAARRPAAGTEAELAAIWAGLLGAPPEHADQSFFAVGGTSLMIPRLLHQVREHLGAEVTVPDFYAHQSLAALAALVDRTR